MISSKNDEGPKMNKSKLLTASRDFEVDQVPEVWDQRGDYLTDHCN